MKATEFLRSVAALTGQPRDAHIIEAAKTGLRKWEWVVVPLENGKGNFRVASDYVAIGDESDWVRVPMGGLAAQAIADQEGAMLPAPFMVELIHRAAEVKLRPITMNLSKMTSTAKFVEHHAKIEAMRANRRGLISGIKKDVVISNKLEDKPNAVCIFGWYQANGVPIQTVSTKHEITYSDYSHGVRLVHPEMVFEGKTVLVRDVLQTQGIAHVLTGGAAWGRKYDAPLDDVLSVVRYGALTPQKVVDNQLPPIANSLGERCFAWCEKEMVAGVKEEPRGSKTSPRIAEYLAPARRRGTEKLLGIRAADWCAAGQSAALAANTDAYTDVPHGYRAAVRELREDAQQTGAWVPIADVKAGKYTPRHGDLLVLRRGTAGLGHVARIDKIVGDYAETIGANEDDTWKRTKRPLFQSDVEGIISYWRFNPGLKLQPTTITPSPPQASTPEVAPAPDDERVDSWARGVVLRAWQRLFPGKPLTTPELQTFMAIGRLERFYGLTKKPAAGIGAKNWGGIQCPKGECGPNCYKAGDKDRDGNPYPICFRKYATDEEGAAALIFQVTTRRPDVWDAIKSGNLTAVATRMSVGRTVKGSWVGVYHETPPQKYAAGLWTHAQIIAKNLGERLAVRLDGKGDSIALVEVPPAAPPTHLQRSNIPAYAPRGRQRGIRALIASRRPELANVVVGGVDPWPTVTELNTRLDTMGELAAELKSECDRTDEVFAYTMTGGVSTSTQVIDYANRTNDYIDALHAIVANARRGDTTNDTFPWTEWAAFRVSWSLAYFDITHSFFPQLDESVVTNYHNQAKDWEEVIAKHYTKRPVVSPTTKSDTLLKLGLGVAGVAALGGLAYFVSR